ncbi:MAG TPA: EthD family reductase [Stellaceae bacterium]
MIKTVGLLTRKAGLSREDFEKHWSEVHAPLAYAVPGVRRYVQSHIFEEHTRPDIPTTEVEIDGIAELWYDDRAAMELANASPEAKRLHADGALFIGRIKSFVVEEKVIIPRSLEQPR